MAFWWNASLIGYNMKEGQRLIFETYDNARMKSENRLVLAYQAIYLLELIIQSTFYRYRQILYQSLSLRFFQQAIIWWFILFPRRPLIFNVVNFLWDTRYIAKILFLILKSHENDKIQLFLEEINILQILNWDFYHPEHFEIQDIFALFFPK